MSMILDALTRAEHERQLEKQPDLKFVSPVKPNKTNPKKIWIWAACALLVNALVLFLVVKALTKNDAEDDQLAHIEQSSITEEAKASVSKPLQQNQISPAPANNNVEQSLAISQQTVEEVAVKQTEVLDSRSLAMEAKNVQTQEVDRPLIYESKQPNSKPKSTMPQQTAKNIQPTKKGNVSFSATELSADDAIPIVNTPRLLIDQGTETSAQAPSSINAPSLRDLPESTRTNLQRYEVNVHVYDDEPIRRFVLINMDKYKEGDRIVNNGPLVEHITADGVVVDYGNGRALLPPK